MPTLTEIGRMPLIAYSRSTYGIEGVLRSRGIEPNVVFRTDESGAVQRLVAAGIGVALVARLSIDTSIPGIVALDASRRVPARPIGLVWHRDVTLSDAARHVRRGGQGALRRARRRRSRRRELTSGRGFARRTDLHRFTIGLEALERRADLCVPAPGAGNPVHHLV